MSTARKGRKHSKEWCRRISEAKRDTKHSVATRKKISKIQTGRRLSEEWKKNISRSVKAYLKRTRPDWREGVASTRRKIKKLAIYRRWRKAVFERDGYACTMCGAREAQLDADHIKPFSRFPKLRFELSNGRTLCAPCHQTTPTYGGRLRSNLATAFGLAGRSDFAVIT